MSTSTELWALYTAETGSSAERLALYIISASADELTGESSFYLPRVVRYLGDPEPVVREALNSLVRKGFLHDVRPDKEVGEGHFDCRVHMNLEDEYKF